MYVDVRNSVSYLRCHDENLVRGEFRRPSGSVPQLNFIAEKQADLCVQEALHTDALLLRLWTTPEHKFPIQ